MRVVIPFHGGDYEQAAELLLWIERLGGAPTHDAILMVDGGLQWDVAVEFLTLANRIFRHVQIISLEESVTGWPRGANALFLKASQHCAELNEPFLWLEPDCVPLSKDWLVRIQKAYSGGFLGHIYECNLPGLPRQLLSGIAVYPPNAYDIIHPRVGNQPHLAWDVSAAEVMVPLAKDSTLFHHIWGNKEQPPTFVTKRTDSTPVNALTLDHIRNGAALFHRNKDGTLRRLVSAKLGMSPLGNFVVVLPVCNHDADLMIRLLDWIAILGNSATHEALVSFDATTMRGSVTRIVSKAQRCFAAVHQTSYSLKKGTVFPQTAAWQHAAHTMAGMNRPWLWLEADCVPLKPNWIAALQEEYDRCGKPFCGPIVHGPDHMNGTGIYPPNTPQLLPRTMSHTNNAFDVECRDEMGPTAHDSALWCLAWGVTRGTLDPVSGTELPSFPRGSPLIKQIPRNAVIFHRDKSGSLIDRLMEAN